MDHSPTPDPDSDFYQRALGRIPRWIALVSLAGLPFAWRHGGPLWAASFLAGCICGYWNYVAICRVVDRLVRTAQPGRSTRKFTLRSFLRLIFVATAVFVIIRFTRINLAAALMGVFAPVAAVVLELLYELTYERT